MHVTRRKKPTGEGDVLRDSNAVTLWKGRDETAKGSVAAGVARGEGRRVAGSEGLCVN